MANYLLKEDGDKLLQESGQPIILDEAQVSYNAPAATGGVKIGGAVTRVLEQVYAVVTQAITMAGTAARAFEALWLVAAAGVILAGSATTAQSDQFNPTVITSDIVAITAGSFTATKAYPVSTQDLKITGTAPGVFIGSHYYTGSGGIVLAGTRGALAIEYLYASVTQDIKLSGSASVTRENVYASITSDLLIKGSGLAAIVKAPAISGDARIILAGSGTYSFAMPGSNTYTGTGGVIVTGTGVGTRVIEQVYATITEPAFNAHGVGTVWTRKQPPVATQRIILSGVGSYSFQQAAANSYTYNGTGGFIVTGTRSALAIEYVYAPITQDIKVAGTSGRAIEQVYASSGGVIVSGASTQAIVYVYATLTQDLKIAGTSTQAIVYLYAPIQQRIIVTGAATSIFAFSLTFNETIGTADAQLVRNPVFTETIGTADSLSAQITGEFRYTGTGGVIVAGAGTRVLVSVYAPSGGVIVTGTATKAIVYLYATITKDIILSGSASTASNASHTYTPSGGVIVAGASSQSKVKAPTVSGGVIVAGASTQTKTKAPAVSGGVVVSGTRSALSIEYVYAPITADIRVSGTAAVAATYLYATLTKDIILSGVASYSFLSNNQNVYTGTGGVIVAGTRSALVVEYVYAPITQAIIVSGSASVAQVQVYAPLTADIRVAGSAAVSVAQLYAPIVRDVILAGSGSWSRAKAPAVQTQRIIVTGSASWARAKTPAITTRDIRVSGSASLTQERVYSPITADIKVSGTVGIASAHIAPVITQDIIVSGHGTSIRQAGYFGSGGVIVGGSYWTHGAVVKFCGVTFSVPQLADMAFTVAGFSGIACDEIADFGDVTFYGAEECSPMIASTS